MPSSSLIDAESVAVGIDPYWTHRFSSCPRSCPVQAGVEAEEEVVEVEVEADAEVIAGAKP
jgi:hypothetical protein